jgi:hypothetical protein
MIHVPEFNSSGMTLLLFNHFTTNYGEKRFPINPHEALGQALCLRAITHEGELYSICTKSVADFCAGMHEMENEFPGLLTGNVVAVHPSRIIRPILRWGAMQGVQGGSFYFDAVDLAALLYGENFYMTFAERSGFSTYTMCKALDMEPPEEPDEYDPIEIWKLCKLIVESPQ